jgi:hypothetical protein
MITLGDNLVAKSGNENYYCEKCDYKCSKKYNWDKHILTSKHLNDYKGDKLVAKSGKKWQKDVFRCEFCDKEYQYRQNLWRHSKNCIHNNGKKHVDEDIDTDKSNKDPSDKELIMLLIKENCELKNIMMKVLENGTHNTTNNTTTHTNSHNKAFNLNFFLNETCKNAMNITDFVDSIKLQLSDLMDVGELGYVEGISKIIVKNLNNLDETIRPIHCTDKKRETFYIKDEDKWEKDDEERKKIKNTIKKVVNKNIRMLPLFKEKFPDYNDSKSKYSDQYSKIVIESMVTDLEKDEKIIKNISKATSINK